MKEAYILVQIISGIIESAKSAGLGRNAISIANGVEGLTVNSDNGVTVTGNAIQIMGDLIRVYEEALKARLSTEVKVALHVMKYAYAAPVRSCN